MTLLPDPPSNHLGAFYHFSKRVRERIGEDVDPLDLWWRAVTGVVALDPAKVEYVGRQDRLHRRIFKLILEDGRRFPMVFDTSEGLPITVLTWDAKPIVCGSKRQRVLTVEDRNPVATVTPHGRFRRRSRVGT